MRRDQQRVICEAKRARELAIRRGDIRRVQALNAIIANARGAAGPPERRP